MTIYTVAPLDAEWAGGGTHDYTYTVPTGHTFVARCLVAKFVNSGDHCYLGVNSGHFLVILKASGALVTEQWDGRIACTAGETLTVSVGSGQVGFRLTGYLLTA